ncbi:hypothetical protein LTR66_010606 [Elasticomyces elasticus]|nr:hypothetical protein LTR66_010606 [Elasticomyces elasticus]
MKVDGHLGGENAAAGNPAQNRAVPAFTATSSSELDEVLETLRSKYFVPAYLNKRQRNLIYRDKYRTQLENEPINATLGDEDVPLEHIDRTKDVPKRLPLLQKAVSLMREKEDWEQVGSMLEGLRTSKAVVKADYMERLVRKANEAGMQHVILRCLQQADKTGLTLRDPRVLEQVLHGLRERAQSGEWAEESVLHAIKQADEVARLLEHEEHGTGRKLSQDDPRTSPTVIGVFLELAAVRAWKHTDKKDEDGTVEKYAERLLAVMGSKTQPSITVSDEPGPQPKFSKAIPVWHGLLLARKILGSKMPQDQNAQRIVKDYEEQLSRACDKLESKADATSPSTFTARAVRSFRDAVRA